MATPKQIEANRKNAKRAGRPKGKRSLKVIAQERAIDVLKNKILKEWEPLIDTKIKLAMGVHVLRMVNGKEEKIYKEKPDGGSLEYLFAMVVGRPKDTIDLKVGRLEEMTNAVKKILGEK